MRCYPGNKIDDDEPCPSRTIVCHSRDRSKSRTKRKQKDEKHNANEPCLSRKMKSHPGDKIEEDKPCTNSKITSFPGHNIEDDKPCTSLEKGCFPGVKIEDDKPCTSLKIRGFPGVKNEDDKPRTSLKKRSFPWDKIEDDKQCTCLKISGYPGIKIEDDKPHTNLDIRSFPGDKIEKDKPWPNLEIEKKIGDKIKDKTWPSLEIRSFPGVKIKDDKQCTSLKISGYPGVKIEDDKLNTNLDKRSFPGDKIEGDKPCTGFKIRSLFGVKIDDNEPCPSRMMICHSRGRSNSRTERKQNEERHNFNKVFESELLTKKWTSNSYSENEKEQSSENKTIQENAKLALSRGFTVSADSAYISCNVKSTTSAGLDELISEGNGKILPKKEAANIDESSKQAEYVYRLLRPNEPYKDGLRPKNIESKASLHQHVAGGSKGVHSRFISCCNTLRALHRLARLTKHPSLVREVVRINVTKLNREEVKVIELLIEDVREKHIKVGSKAWGFVENFDEVILEPKTHVPADCVERIGIVKDNVFTKDEHITL